MTFKAQMLFRQTSVDWMFTVACGGASNFHDAAVALNANVIANVLPLLGTDVTFLGTSCHDPINKVTRGEFVAAASGSVGAGGSTALPPVCAIVATLYYNSYGRGRTGKIFLAGVPIIAQNGALVSDAFRNDLETNLKAFKTQMTADTFPWHVASTKAKLDGTLTDLEVVDLTVRNSIRENKRREYGRSITGLHHRVA